ncbi:MAG: hypothetical protein CME19_19850 [Gemmatimonadetes bacterium]|nr:hypothetical protein [Gemmatimonadota bacterium]
MLVHNLDWAQTRFIPASTYKIPNTIIALETGVADSAGFAIAWDSTKAVPGRYWPRSWKRDQTLTTAFRNSVSWYYQEIARGVGRRRIQQHVNCWGYGKRNLEPAVGTFWLYGDLRISPLEQVDFIQRYRNGRLDISERTTTIMQEIMVMERTETYLLLGKTSTGEVTPTRELGWLVGYVESRGGEPGGRTRLGGVATSETQAADPGDPAIPQHDPIAPSIFFIRL